MNTMKRRAGATGTAILAAFAGTLLLLHLLVPRWTSVFRLDETDLEMYRSEEQRKLELHDELERLNTQIGASDAVAVSLIEERIAFAAAVNVVEMLNRDRPGFEQVLPSIYPETRSHRERIARYTMDKVRAKLEGDPTRQVETLARLEAAYREEFSRP